MPSFVTPEVATVGTTPQTLFSAGVGESAELIAVIGYNRDTVQHTLTLKKTGGSITPITIGVAVLAAGERNGNILEAPAAGLDGSGEAFTIESDATATTTEPCAHAVGYKVP